MSAQPLILARRRSSPGSLTWAVAGLAACLAVGVVTAASPVVALVAAGAVVAVVAVVAAPFPVLLAALVLRPALDVSGSFADVGGFNLAGALNGAMVVGGGLALVLVLGGRLPARGFVWAYAGVLAIGAVSLLWSIEPSTGARTWVGLAAPFVVFALAARVVRDERRFAAVAIAASASAVVPLLVAAGQVATGNTFEFAKDDRLTIAGTFAHPNGFAFFLLVAAPATIVALDRFRGRARVALVLLLAAEIVFLVTTWTRSAWIGFAVIVLGLAVTRFRRLVPAVAVAVVVAALAAPALLGQVSSRFADLSPTSSSYASNSLGWRADNWSRMWPYATERPVAGQGMGSYLALSDREFSVFDYAFQTEESDAGEARVPAHNDYLLTAVELGIPAAVLWLVAYLALAWALWRRRHDDVVGTYALMTAIALVTLATVSFFDNVRAYNAVGYLVFALAGAVLGVAAQRRAGRRGG